MFQLCLSLSETGFEVKLNQIFFLFLILIMAELCILW
jgi:hypothetical protein